eukprot:13094266-Ditylum_brightwellii.AAC.1
MFRERYEEEYWGSKWLVINGKSHRAFHATAYVYIEKYRRETWDKAYTFTLVRHPLVRQVSNFFFLTSMGCNKPYSKCNKRLIQVLDLDSMTENEKINAFQKWTVKLYNTFPLEALSTTGLVQLATEMKFTTPLVLPRQVGT